MANKTTLEFVKEYNYNNIAILSIIEGCIIAEVEAHCESSYDEENDGEYEEYIMENLTDDRMSDVIGGACALYVTDYHTLAACYLADDYSEEFVKEYLERYGE